MQKITVKEVKGPLGKGEKKFYAVVDEKGAEFTTFDTKMAKITPGSVLEAEVVVDGKYVNITEWKVLEEGKPSAGNGRVADSRTAEQFEADRRSNESIAAYNGIMGLAKQGIEDERFKGIYNLALNWAELRLAVSPKKAEPAKTAPKQTAVSQDDTKQTEPTGGFQNAGQFLTKCKEVFGLNRTQALEHEEVEKLFDANEFNKAFLRLSEIVSQRKV